MADIRRFSVVLFGLLWVIPTFAWGQTGTVSGARAVATTSGVSNTLADWMSYLTGTSNPNPVVFGSTFGVAGVSSFTGAGTFGVGSGGAGAGLTVNNTANIGVLATAATVLSIGSGATTNQLLSLGNNTWTGPIAVTYNGAAGAGRYTRWLTAGTPRWQLSMSGTESGSNVGGNLTLNGFSDAGSNNGLGPTFVRNIGGFDLTQSYTFANDAANTFNNVLIDVTQTMGGVFAMSPQYNLWVINDNAGWLTPSTTTQATGLQFIHKLGSGITGNRFGLSYAMQQSASSGGTFAQNSALFWDPINASFISSVNSGGVSTSTTGSRGGTNTANFTVHLQSGATNFAVATAQENDCQLDTGSSTTWRACLSLVNTGSSTVQGRVVDAGLWIYGVGDPFRTAIMFGSSQGLPISSGGDLITFQKGYSGKANAALFGIDLLDLGVAAFNTTQDNAIFRSNGFAVDGVGTIRTGSCYQTWSATGEAYDCKGSVGATGTPPTIVAAGDNWNVTDLASDGFGGVVKITQAVLKSATVGAGGGGTGGTNGACTATATSSAGAGGTLFQVSGTVTGGALAGALTVAVAGVYNTPIPIPESEPITGCGLAGATVAVDMAANAIAWDTDVNSNTRVPTYPSTTPPGNPLSMTAYSTSMGTGLTVSETWNTTATTLALQPSGGGITISGTAAVSCAANTVVLSTLVVTKGIVTHC